ncbi:MAG: hypothetical protein GX219_03775, partial [Tissierellia bacterium]|nr:hypothetical protein [Tissierellia bacterium]
MKKVVSLLLAILLILGSGSVFAADMDLFNKVKLDGSRDYTFDEFVGKDDAFSYVADHMIEYVIEHNGLYYNVQDVQDYLDANPEASFIDAINSLAGKDVPKPAPAPDALEVVSVSAINLRQVEVKFNTAVDKTTAQTITNYGGLSITPNGAVLQSDNKTVILNLGATLVQYQDYPITIVNVKSADGKVMQAYNTTIKPVDTTIPTLVSVTPLGSATLELTFSEPIQNLATVGNYKIDNVVHTSTATASAFDTKVTLVLPADLVPGEHKVAVFADGTLDLRDYANLLVPAKELKFTVEEDTALPQVSSIEVLSQTKVKVTFSKPMNITNANIGDFYWNTTGMASDVAKPANAQKKIDANTFEITFTTNPLPAGEVHFFVKDVRDFNGNPIAGNVATNRYSEKVTVTADAAPTVTGVKAKTDTTIEVTFSTDMKQASAQTASKYVVKDGEGKTVNLTGAPSYNTTTKVVTLTLATAMSGTKDYTVTV